MLSSYFGTTSMHWCSNTLGMLCYHYGTAITGVDNVGSYTLQSNIRSLLQLQYIQYNYNINSNH